MPVATIYWDNGIVKLVDQTKLPHDLVYAECKTKEDIWHAIKVMQIRGAPAIGVASGFGVFFGMKDSKASTYNEFKNEIKGVISYLASVRPTAVNLIWALSRMEKVVEDNAEEDIPSLKNFLLSEALKILEEDKQICRKMARFGSRLIPGGSSILTHCNAGGLATADYGTALGVLFCAKEEGKNFHVYVDETRPVLQGARITAWELMQAGIDCTLICDNMAAGLMKDKRINLVLVGGDRIASNGDTANKIGTYSIACLAAVHNIPFYVAAPRSSFDLSRKDGNVIPIEERSPREVTHIRDKRVAPEGVKVYNPAFDVTPGSLISSFITEKGIIEPPYQKNIKLKFG